MNIEQNIISVREKVRNAAKKVNRNPENIHLVAVTKNVSSEIIQKAVDAGISILGENRVQEASSKINRVNGKVDWHMIGHLQTNKSKVAVELFSMIHSVDSVKLAKEIDKRASRIGKTMNILVQVNIGREETKFGVKPECVADFIRKIAPLSNIKIKGLMAMAPYSENPEDARKYFRRMKKLFDDIKNSKIENISMEYLSMGMTGDFEVAIEEGSNMVRIGTGIFGERR